MDGQMGYADTLTEFICDRHLVSHCVVGAVTYW